jgi:hypothetical protein
MFLNPGGHVSANSLGTTPCMAAHSADVRGNQNPGPLAAGNVHNSIVATYMTWISWICK